MLKGVVVDHDPERREVLRQFLENKLLIPILGFGGWDELESHAVKALNTDEQWKLVVMPFDLHGKVGAIRERLIYRVGYFVMSSVFAEDGRIFILLHHPGYNLPLTGIDSRVKVWETGGKELDDVRLESLDFAGLSLPRLPSISIEGEDYIFRQQLEWLNPKSVANGAVAVIQKLVHKFRKKCHRATIRGLTQGFSGSLVMELNIEIADAPTETVLMKISSAREVWKTHHILHSLEEINRTLNPGGLTRNTPSLLLPDEQSERLPFLVEFSTYIAEFWQFLGGHLGEFVDWNGVYCGGANDLPSCTEFVRSTIRLLRKAWLDSATWTETAALWDEVNIQFAGVATTPPYRLSPSWRARIQMGLAKFDRLGSRLDSKGWDRDRKIIDAWLNNGPAVGSVGRQEAPILISRVHGDLNKGNILWWKDEDRPILIDFATFSPHSHGLQDLANLECEVRFGLMYCEDSPVAEALDLTDKHLLHWKERDQILVPEFPTSLLSFTPYKNDPKHHGSARAEQVIMLIRLQASEVHAAAASRSQCSHLVTDHRFDDEYTAALLYPTLRAIGYADSLSPFKRMLAVHSAARLISRLNRPAQAGDLAIPSPAQR